MLVLADVVVSGLALATLVFLPLSFACSLTATSWLTNAMRCRRPWSIIAGTSLVAFIAVSIAVLLFFTSLALSFALSRGKDSELFRPLFGLAILVAAALHILVFYLSRRRFTSDTASTSSDR